MSSVQTIVLDQYEKTIKVGQGSTVYGSVRPYSVTNKCVWYETNKPDTLFVDRETGYFVGLKVGTVLITVYSDENPSIKSFCEVTIEEAIHVSTLWLSHSKMTLKVGDYTDDLCVEVLPDIATNKNVRFESSNSNVAIVYSDGSIKAKSPGTAVITAISEDGGHTATCTVRVVIDEVIIQKDDLSAEIVYTSTNKIWKCIFADMIYNEDARLNFILNQRVWHNLYVNHPINQNLKTYTDEELKLLYSIDPHGVAIYIESYAAEKYSDLKKRIEYKDSIFKVLFDREPLYFRRTSENEWIKTNDTSNISEVLSESETIFGMHPIWDDISLDQLLSIGIKIVELAVEVFIAIKFPNMSFTNKFIYQTVEDVVKAFVLLTSGVNTIELFELVQDELGDQTFKNTSLVWVNDFVSPIADLYDIIRTKISVSPNLNIKIMKHCAYDFLYNVELKLANGDIHNLQEVCSIIN